MKTCVWASRPLVELNNQTGFVECDDALAAQLLAADLVQDPRDGGTAMRYIDETPLASPKRVEREAPITQPAHEEQTYDDKAMLPKRTRK